MRDSCDRSAPFEAVLTCIEQQLLNDFQRDFPLVPRPFAALAARLGVTEKLVLDTLRSLQLRGLVSRVGAVFRPNVVGVSTLAALAVPAARLESVALQISAFAEVNHNYEREHHFNLWFVATAGSADALHALLNKIETACDAGPILRLPLLEPFHIDLGFDLRRQRGARSEDKAGTKPSTELTAELADTREPWPASSDQTSLAEVAAIALSPAEQTLIAALQNGLPLVAQPFAQLGWPEQEAIATLARWSRDGVIKRFGVVVRHHELGYTANAMVVWDVPDALVSAVGRRIAASCQVSLCYRRPRRAPHWPYNLFCMMHGQDRDAVEQRIAALVLDCGLSDYPHAILFSRRRFKQCGAQYVPNPVKVVQAESADAVEAQPVDLAAPQELAYGSD